MRTTMAKCMRGLVKFFDEDSSLQVIQIQGFPTNLILPSNKISPLAECGPWGVAIQNALDRKGVIRVNPKRQPIVFRGKGVGIQTIELKNIGLESRILGNLWILHHPIGNMTLQNLVKVLMGKFFEISAVAQDGRNEERLSSL